MSGSSLTAKVAIIEASLERRECLLSLSLDAGERDPSDGYEDRRLAADAVSLDEVQAGRAIWATRAAFGNAVASTMNASTSREISGAIEATRVVGRCAFPARM